VSTFSRYYRYNVYSQPETFTELRSYVRYCRYKILMFYYLFSYDGMCQTIIIISCIDDQTASCVSSYIDIRLDLRGSLSLTLFVFIPQHKFFIFILGFARWRNPVGSRCSERSFTNRCTSSYQPDHPNSWINSRRSL
jgi:hypothetical protein